MMLLEGLIAILVFSLGILAIVGMQATVIKEVGDAKYRSDAAMLANQLIGTMWASDRASSSLQNNFDTSLGSGSTALTQWESLVKSTLPGVTGDNQPTVGVVSYPGNSKDGTVTITLYWSAPGEVATQVESHKYVAIAQIQ